MKKGIHSAQEMAKFNIELKANISMSIQPYQVIVKLGEI